MIARVLLAACALAAGELDRLRELAELGLDAELAKTGAPLVAPGAELAAEGEAIALVARALFNTGDEEGALRLLADARPSPAGRGQVQLARARLLIERDDLQGAVGLLIERPGAFDRLRFPDEPESHLLLGRALVRLTRHDLAEKPLDAFVKRAPLHPEGPSAWHMLFECALQRGDSQRAAACRDEAARLRLWHDLMKARRLQARRDPKATLPRLGIALLWIEVNELERARAGLEEVLAMDAELAEAWLHLGEVHRKLGAAAEAEKAYARALAADANEHRARLSLAVLQLANGRAAQARAALEVLVGSEVEAEPAFLDAHLLLARILRDAGDAGADARYARYLELGGTEAL